MEQSLKTRNTPVPVYDSANLPPAGLGELKALGEYRYLLWNLIYRDVTVRYKRSWLGIFWIMLQPLVLMGVLTIVFSTRFKSDIENFPVFLLAGLIIWQIFTEGSMSATRIMIAQGHIISKIYVPPSIFLLGSVCSTVIIHAFELLPLMLIAVVLGAQPYWAWVFMVIPILQTGLLALGVGLLLASAAVYFEDTITIYEVILRMGFFLTPVFYPLSSLSGQLRPILEFGNPVVYVLKGFRRVILEGQLLFVQDVLVTTGIVLVFVILGWITFTKVKHEFVFRV